MINRKIKEEIERLKNRVEVLEFLRENPSGFGVFHAVAQREIPVWIAKEFYKCGSCLRHYHEWVVRYVHCGEVKQIDTGEFAPSVEVEGNIIRYLDKDGKCIAEQKFDIERERLVYIERAEKNPEKETKAKKTGER